MTKYEEIATQLLEPLSQAYDQKEVRPCCAVGCTLTSGTNAFSTIKCLFPKEKPDGPWSFF